MKDLDWIRYTEQGDLFRIVDNTIYFTMNDFSMNYLEFLFCCNLINKTPVGEEVIIKPDSVILRKLNNDIVQIALFDKHLLIRLQYFTVADLCSIVDEITKCLPI